MNSTASQPVAVRVLDFLVAVLEVAAAALMLSERWSNYSFAAGFLVLYTLGIRVLVLIIDLARSYDNPLNLTAVVVTASEAKNDSLSASITHSTIGHEAAHARGDVSKLKLQNHALTCTVALLTFVLNQLYAWMYVSLANSGGGGEPPIPFAVKSGWNPIYAGTEIQHANTVQMFAVYGVMLHRPVHGPVEQHA